MPAWIYSVVAALLIGLAAGCFLTDKVVSAHYIAQLDAEHKAEADKALQMEHDAFAKEAADDQAVKKAEDANNAAQALVDSLSTANAQLLERVREYANRGSRPLPAPPGGPAGPVNPAAPPDFSDGAVAALAEFSTECAEVRDREAGRLAALQALVRDAVLTPSGIPTGTDSR